MKIIAENVKFRHWNCDVILDKYAADGSDALVLIDHETSERIAVATTCLAGEGYEPAIGCAALKNYSENEWMLEALTAAGIIQDTGQRVSVGYVSVPIVRILKRTDVDEVAA